MTEYPRPSGYKAMCFLGVVENVFIVVNFGFSFVVSVFLDAKSMLREGAWETRLDMLIGLIMLLLGVAGVVISLALLKRGRAAVMALDFILVLKWLFFLVLLAKALALFFNLRNKWNMNPGLAMPGREHPSVALVSIVAYLILNIPLFVASAYWWRPKVRRYAIA